MPVLHKGNIIGTLDPRVDRAKHTLIVNRLTFTSGALPDADVVKCVSRALVSLAKFVECSRVEIKSTKPSQARSILQKTLREWTSL